MKNSRRNVLITGAAQGIGKQIAIDFAKAGWIVSLVDVDQNQLEKTLAEVRIVQPESIAIQCDVKNPDSIIKAVTETQDKLKGIQCVINNAGISKWKSPYELSVEEWDEIIHTNLRSVFLFSREAAKYMSCSDGGTIINMTSTRAFMSEPDSEAYAATKGGIVALTHALAASLAKDKITVNSISPGWIHTGDYSKLRDIDHEQHLSKRVGKPSDISRACLFLADPENDFITGENMVIDGGMTRKMIYEH
ncbi:SDR family NAD(P)-dependent oxidoreductase [Fictibacillus barbaricus]|uniref:NAD(P)-dependent dehydrogenase (Short-subunit alcohol dehydrogenase family) n=1 Tax=Fictibacillus barbaricus TaxID=182136 RepID=A0ABU1TXZ8_9BACL|nr:SDR family oxidoreductase [Fictibacillus barbaricus]MDR7072067.1 NAD(P)-dependent dehydrogenase (short-subunit alcohol dehydrogenase family) [Fictibacillus barbaricus]